MRYEYVGVKIPHKGKTLWEILGNLKNFGIGRLIKKSPTERFPEVSFMKIVKVLPVPPSKSEGEPRRVLFWCEEVFRGVKLPVQEHIKFTDIAKFQLIPKIEEEQYLQKAAEFKPQEKHINKYTAWPPLYKKLWEEQKENKETIPKLKVKINELEYRNYVYEEKVGPLSTCSLYKKNQTVEEMYQEIVRLKKIINAHKNL